MAKLLHLSRPSRRVSNVVRAWLAARRQKQRRRQRNADTPDTPPVGLGAPGSADWSLQRVGNRAVANFLGQAPEPFTDWNAQFRAVGDAAWLDAGGDTLDLPLGQLFDPWPQGGVEAHVQYTDGQGTPKSDWSALKQLP